MKKQLKIFGLLLILFSCQKQNAPLEGKITFRFSHNWDGTSVTQADFNTIKFTNANGDNLSIERLRYLISRITLVHEDGITTVLDGYRLIDLQNPESMTFEVSQNIVLGHYNKVAMTFGFNPQDNQSGAYPDLNVATWNVPGMLGGGYHFMQLDGKYRNHNSENANYNFHAIRAVNKTDPDNLIFQDTHFEIDLGGLNINDQTQVDVKMNIAEWFKNPNLWDLNELDTMLMPNFEAQVKMSENGMTVFSGQTMD